MESQHDFREEKYYKKLKCSGLAGAFCDLCEYKNRSPFYCQKDDYNDRKGNFITRLNIF